MTKFHVGDRVQVNLDHKLNKDTRSPSTNALLKHLKTHQNIFTVKRVVEFGRAGDLIHFEETVEDNFGGFDPERFLLVEDPTFNITTNDLEDLLNG